MKIIVVCAIFPPEPFIAAQTACSMAKKLTVNGHQVIVLTSYPNRPEGKIYDGYSNRLFSREISQFGYKVVRCFTSPSSKSSFQSRLIENLVFGASSALYLMFIPKIDLICSDTWPIFATGLISLVARIRHIHYVICVSDLYPESLVAQKRLRQDSWVTNLMRKIDQWIARGAAHLTVLTNSFARVYQEDRKISSEKISVVPNWIEDNLNLVDANQVREIRQRFEIKDSDFLLVYGGNIGVGAGVDTFIKACTLVDDVKAIIAGGGSELPACKELVSRMHLAKISFFCPWPEDKTMALYQAADLLVLPTHGEQSVASIPSKTLHYMLSGRPIIVAGIPCTELCNLVEESECGWIIPPDDPEALAHMIEEVIKIGQIERDRRGKAGREYVLKNLTADIILPKLINIIENVNA